MQKVCILDTSLILYKLSLTKELGVNIIMLYKSNIM